jgi:hypothetical protein
VILLAFYAFRTKNAAGSTTESNGMTISNRSKTHPTLHSDRQRGIPRKGHDNMLDVSVGLHARFASMKEGVVYCSIDSAPLQK